MAIKESFYAEIIGIRENILIIECKIHNFVEGQKLSLSIFQALRTIAQNSLFWRGIDKLAKASDVDKELVYVGILEQANILSQYHDIKPDNYDKWYLENNKKYRRVKITDIYLNNDGDYVLKLECILGSSNFDKKQFAELLKFLSRKLAYYNIDF